MKILLITILTLISTNTYAQINPTDLSFYPMEAMDTLKSFNIKSYAGSIKKIDEDTFLLNGYNKEIGAFLVKKIKDKYIVFNAESRAYWSWGDLKVIKSFVVIEYTNGGTSTTPGWSVTNWTNSFFQIINTSTLKVINFQSEYQIESSIFPKQKRKESDDDYDERRSKESKTVSENCESKIKFDGLYLKASRTYKNGCKVCLETGTYKLVKNKFIKLSR